MIIDAAISSSMMNMQGGFTERSHLINPMQIEDGNSNFRLRYLSRSDFL